MCEKIPAPPIYALKPPLRNSQMRPPPPRFSNPPQTRFALSWNINGLADCRDSSRFPRPVLAGNLFYMKTGTKYSRFLPTGG
jgi:hypothetical protein